MPKAGMQEPLAALDTPTRLRVRGELRQLLRVLAIPTVLVTHDRYEALALGDAVVVLHGGRNVQQGSAQEVFSRPVNLAVAEITVVETVQRGRVLETRDGLVTIAVGDGRLTGLARDLPPGTSEVHVCIRAEDVMLTRPDVVQASARTHLAVTVRTLAREGPMVCVLLDGGLPLKALLTQSACEALDLQAGGRFVALIKTPQVHVIPFVC
jgi:molybdate transport system ATP-binding protein